MCALLTPEVLQAGAVKGLITLNFVVSIARSTGNIDFFLNFLHRARPFFTCPACGERYKKRERGKKERKKEKENIVHVEWI